MDSAEALFHTPAMLERLNSMPAYAVTEGQVPADQFNLLRLALLRLGSPLEIPLPALRSLHLHVDDDCWAVLDSALNDVPVAAWTHFRTADRDSLHRPIICRITLYHAHAGLILESALHEAIEQIRPRLSSSR